MRIFNTPYLCDLGCASVCSMLSCNVTALVYVCDFIVLVKPSARHAQFSKYPLASKHGTVLIERRRKGVVLQRKLNCETAKLNA